MICDVPADKLTLVYPVARHKEFVSTHKTGAMQKKPLVLSTKIPLLIDKPGWREGRDDEHENFSPVTCLALRPASRLSHLWSLPCQMCLEQLQLYLPCSPHLEKLLGCCNAAAQVIKKGLMLQLFQLEVVLPQDKLSPVFLRGPLARWNWSLPV